MNVIPSIDSEERASKRSRLESVSSLEGAINAKAELLGIGSSTLFQDNFRFIPEDTDHPSFIVREKDGIREIVIINEEDVIGEGAFATVYKVHVLGSEQILALKIRTDSSDDGSLSNMNNECAVRKEMGSGGIRRGLPVMPYGYVYEMPAEGGEGDVLGFFSEKYDGDYAKKITDKQDLPLDYLEIGKEFIDIVSALFNFHELGYVHCDIKPANFLYKDGVVHLTDFGNAKAFDDLDNVDDEDDAVRAYSHTLSADEDAFVELSNEMAELEGSEEDYSQDDDIEVGSRGVEDIKSDMVRLHKAMDVFGAGIIFYERCFGYNPNLEEDDLSTQDESEVTLIPGLKDLIDEMMNPRYQDRPSTEVILGRLGGIFA